MSRTPQTEDDQRLEQLLAIVGREERSRLQELLENAKDLDLSEEAEATDQLLKELAERSGLDSLLAEMAQDSSHLDGLLQEYKADIENLLQEDLPEQLREWLDQESQTLQRLLEELEDC